MNPPSSNPITDRRVNEVLDRLHARAARELPGLVANLALGAVKGLLGSQRRNDSDETYVRDKLIPIDRGQGWLIYMLCPRPPGPKSGRVRNVVWRFHAVPCVGDARPGWRPRHRD